MAVFPELCLSGYAIENFLLRDALLDATERALAAIVKASSGFMSVLVVDAPLRRRARTLQLRCRGTADASSASYRKHTCPTYREFYEVRHFGSGKDVVGLEISIGTMRAPFGADPLFEANDVPGPKNLDSAFDPLGPLVGAIQRRRLADLARHPGSRDFA
jgi:NAD+ synthase (glutamine-hydrolysing)